MEPIQKQLSPVPQGGRRSYEEIVQSVVTDPRVAQFITEHQLTDEQIDRSLSKFLEFISEYTKFEEQAADYIADGYQPVLIMNEGYADVSYLETERLIQQRKADRIKDRIRLIGLPKNLRNITAADIFKDPNRLRIYQEIQQFVTSGGQGQKGFYLYGNFGVGKSYLMGYLAYRLSEVHQLSTTMIHYPTFVVDIKNAIKDATVKEKIDELKEAEVLVLDDIGAEQHSPWVRDDVLQVILQYRMQEDLPTFFTSNFSFADLERHFATSKSGDETWQAQRVMERIRYLSQEIYLEGINRRHESNY